MSEKNDKTAYSPLDAYSATDALKSGLEEGTEPEQFANSGNSSISVNDLENEVAKLKQELFNLRFQLAVGQLENTARINKVKKSIAVMKTIITEKTNALVK